MSFNCCSPISLGFITEIARLCSARWLQLWILVTLACFKKEAMHVVSKTSTTTYELKVLPDLPVRVLEAQRS